MGLLSNRSTSNSLKFQVRQCSLGSRSHLRGESLVTANSLDTEFIKLIACSEEFLTTNQNVNDCNL